jgi:jumonji domain-containing protein 7
LGKRGQFGESKVHVKISPDGEFEGCEDANLWEPADYKPIPAAVLGKLQSPDKVVVRPASIEVIFIIHYFNFRQIINY